MFELGSSEDVLTVTCKGHIENGKDITFGSGATTWTVFSQRGWRVVLVADALQVLRCSHNCFHSPRLARGGQQFPCPRLVYPRPPS